MVKWKNKLQEKEGAGLIESAIGILIACLVMACILQTISVMVYKYQMGICADKVAGIVSVSGKYDQSVRNEIQDYLTSTNLKNPQIELNGTEYLNGTAKIQLNDRIKVTVLSSYNIGFSFFTIPISLRNVSQSRSEVYWK